MATRNALYAKVLWVVAAAAVLAASALAAGGRAQSGRIVPPPTPTPTPTPTPAPKFVVAPNEDRYKLIYSPGWDGALRAGSEDEADRARHSRIDNFVARLNEAGARGYRLLCIVNGWQPVAVVELDRVQYEYGWFETAVVGRSERDFRIVYTRFLNAYAKQAGGGFRLAEHFVNGRGCLPLDPFAIWAGERCVFKDLYLLEREKGVEKPLRTHLAISAPGGRSSRMGDELTAQVKEKLAEGLRPAYAFSRFAVLLEESDAGREPAPGASEFRVVTLSSWGNGDIEKMVNELARQGYRMHLNNNGVAVMRRRAGDSTPAEYLWLNAKEKNFEKRLAAAQEAGAVYRMTYPDGGFDETRLVFERAPGGGGRRDYKVFRVELQFAENVAAKKVAVGLSPQTREALKTVESLLREGYVVRDLFWADAAHLLLERTR